jgi:hypothetical protein
MADRSSEKKGLVGHPLGLAVVVGVQICMSVLVTLGQVCRTGDRREPEQCNCKDLEFNRTDIYILMNSRCLAAWL